MNQSTTSTVNKPQDNKLPYIPQGDPRDILLDTWSVTGSGNKQKLYSILKYLTDITKSFTVRSDQLSLLTVRDITNTLDVYVHEPGGIKNIGIPFDVLQKQGSYDKLLDETNNRSHLIFKIGEGFFFTTKKVLTTLSQRAGSNLGDFALRDEVLIRFYRDAGYSAYMRQFPRMCNVLFREVNGAKKIQAVFGEKYKIIPQYPLIKLLIDYFEKELGDGNLVNYTVDNFDTDVYLEFPKKGDDFSKVYQLKDAAVPGIHIHISDTGNSSFVINGTIRVKNTVVNIPTAEYKRAHTTKANIDHILSVVGTTVFSEYTLIPMRLVDLLQIDISNPAQIIPKVARYCNIKKELGLSVEKEVVDTLINSLNPMINYTAYDIALLFLDVSENLTGSNAAIIQKKRDCFVKAVLFKYENEA